MAIERRRVLFSGRVQGVFFRATAAELAARLAVSGWVRNLPDGTVELEAQGESTEIDRLIADIRKRYEGFIAEASETLVGLLGGDRGFQVLR